MNRQLLNVAREITDATGYSVNVATTGNMHYVNVIKQFHFQCYEGNDIEQLVNMLINDYKLV